VVTYISSGNDYTILEFPLTDAFSNISVSRSAKSFSMQARSGSKLKWRRSATDTGEWTLDGTTYSIDGSVNAQDGLTVVIGQCKCADVGGTDTLELWVWF
jgi:hypothetical protein